MRDPICSSITYCVTYLPMDVPQITISSIDRRLKREIIRDKKIKRNVEALTFELSKGQE